MDGNLLTLCIALIHIDTLIINKKMRYSDRKYQFFYSKAFQNLVKKVTAIRKPFLFCYLIKTVVPDSNVTMVVIFRSREVVSMLVKSA